ncbi:hypothetical protein PHYSODRAFT_321342 [Phytophthora sojae]|uniref:Uncharacterized protein n=1 Tax=Phytophthora sojae (strain P6497) TaxID=1094619 RepID=G4YM18_PHYSP|nr:hypothetical protein PHYSODRAFT_321342 [Phytophthora sojae]EGZ27548.1 hypothetical protein PHYSODRAFT_321342 [Phytophthora sojae]|eukprot:XP_009514823.1 hypothetical protein PHYSODRAFT_321342 [Phytophthora sojae]
MDIHVDQYRAAGPDLRVYGGLDYFTQFNKKIDTYYLEQGQPKPICSGVTKVQAFTADNEDQDADKQHSVDKQYKDSKNSKYIMDADE